VDLVRHYRNIPWSGDAKYWYDLAVKNNFEVGNKPQKNAIWVTEGGKHGHIALVIEIYKNSFLVLEQNVQGRWIVSTRIIKLEDNMLFIY